MHSAKIAVLFAGAAAAQSSAVILNLFDLDSTLTFKNAESSTSTYENVCKPTSALPGESSSVPLSSLATSTIADPSQILPLSSGALTLTAILPNPTGSVILMPSVPIPTARALLRRQDDSDDEDCEPFTLIQGPETWQFHLTNPTPGILTMDGGCNWKGQLTNATITCTLTRNGTALGPPTVMTSEIGPSELSSIGAIETMAIVTASTTPGLASATTTGAETKSTGGVEGRTMPTGVMGLVGGAAGILVAALAL